MSEKHKNFVFSLGNKVSLTAEGKHQTIEQQQNHFLGNLTSLVKALDGPSPSEAKSRNKDFWVRKNAQNGTVFGNTTTADQIDGYRTAEDNNESKQKKQVAFSKDIESSSNNKQILIDLAAVKMKKQKAFVLKDSKNTSLDETQRRELAHKSLETVVYKVGSHFDHLKRSGVLNSLKASYNEVVDALVQKTQKMDDAENIPIQKDAAEKGEVSFIYLKYLKKRRHH